MAKSYNQLAGRGLERMAALSDGLFAIAMTLIVLDIRLPSHAGIVSDATLLAALGALAPQFITYLLSFMTLGIFWVGQQTQLNHFTSLDRNLSWIHLGFLAAVAVTPFTTSLLASFITLRSALLLYWLNIVVLGAFVYWSWSYAARTGLVKTEGAPPNLSHAMKKRIIVAQSLYAFGALLCVFNTFWSLGFIVLVQLNYAFAPKIPVLKDV